VRAGFSRKLLLEMAASAASRVVASCLFLLLPAMGLALTPIVTTTAYREFYDVANQVIPPTTQMILDSQQRFLTLLDDRLQKSGDSADVYCCTAGTPMTHRSARLSTDSPRYLQLL